MSPSKRKQIKKGSLALYILMMFLATSVMIFLHKYIQEDNVVNTPLNKDKVVAIEYAPMFLYTYDDTLGGFSYDLLNLVVKQGGLQMKYQPVVTLSTALEKLRNGEYKMVCAEFPVTKEHKQEYLFTNPIYLDRQVLVQRKDSVGGIVVESQLDLAQDTVWVIDGSSAELRLKNLSHEIGNTIYVKTETSYGAEQLFLRVASGEIKNAVMNERIAMELAKKYPNVDISTGISFTQFQSWILNKNDSVFCDSINKWLDAVKLTPEYATLYNRYFPE